DEDLLSSQALERCYLIKATNKTFSSFSNIICLKYKPVIFIPNAISPNHDGLNDVFNPVIYGVDLYKLKIYNRWGEEVYSEKNGAWLPDEKQSGVFMYQITLITAEGEIVHQTGTISVVR
ncbi:MAG: hypothetical protein GC181_16345, partial [Bacteroidetes bacterium]|nr:hypothetical protein [Bacteroidota bacterium]